MSFAFAPSRLSCPQVLTVVFLSLSALGSNAAWALPTYSPGNVSALTNDSVEALLKTIALGADHRAYMPASPLGMIIGLDVGLDVTGINVSDEFRQAMSAAGVSSSIPAFIPIPKLNVTKGLPLGIDLGMTFVGYQHNRILGAQIQWAFLNGAGMAPAAAVRLSQSYVDLFFMKTRVTKLDVLASRRFVYFFEPYVGAGLQVGSGSLDVPVSGPNGLKADVSGNTSFTAIHAFGGMKFNLSFLKLVTEVDRSFVGLTTFGGKFSFGF